MKLYEINDGIAVLREFGADPETGEILDLPEEDIEEMIEVLQLDRTEKIENIACLCKELKKEAEALAETKKEIAARYDAEINARKRRIESLKNYLMGNLEEGEKVKTMRASIFWKIDSSVVIDDIYRVPVEYYKIVEPEASKTAIKDAIKDGLTVPGAHIESKASIQIR